MHDGKADKAAASLDVAVGHLYDPVSEPLRSQCGLSMTQITRRMTCPDWPTSANTYYSWFVTIVIGHIGH